MNQFSRTELIIGKENLLKLNRAKVSIYGIGGVGSYAVEALARSGIGSFVLIDNDTISITNINRQIHALYSTIGEPKVDIMKKRILDINPNANVITYQQFYTTDTAEELFHKDSNYIVDAVDNVTAKLDIIQKAKNSNIPIISCMGTGNKLDPFKFEIADISKTSTCPLAKVIRKELKERGIKDVKVLYSTEMPIRITNISQEKLPEGKHQIPGSISFIPSIAGLMIASEVIRDLIK